MIKRIAIAFGVIFLIVGALGFVPVVTPGAADGVSGRLLGVFAVDPAHNLVHIVTGLIAIGVGMVSDEASRMYFKVFGIIYGLVAILGFGYGSAPLLGLMANNLSDAVLHAVIAAAALFLGFGHLPARFEHPHDTGHHPA